MSDSPITNNTDLVTYSISSEGSLIPDTYQVVSIEVNRAVNKVASCELEISDGNPAKSDFPISDSDTFIPGNSIEVSAGYEGDNQVIFEGIIVKQGIKISQGEGPILVVTCKDKAIKMTVGRKNAYFTDTTDSDIISGLIDKNGLTPEVSSTDNELKEVIQYYSTDWDFAVARADINGMVVSTNNGTVSVTNPDDDSDSVLTLDYGNDILEFEGEINAVNQYGDVTSSAWDYTTQSVVSGDSSVSDSGLGNLSSDTLSEVIGLDEYDLQAVSPDEGLLNTWASALTTKSKYAKVKGFVSFQGNAQPMPGTSLTLTGLGDRFTGTGFISGVRHEISDGDWITTAHIGLSTEWFTEQVKTEAPLSSGLLPGIQGLQIGKVKQISEDPDSEFRVLITLPLIQTSEDGVWARLANLYATSGAGDFFYPEVDDEVVVGFFNDNPSYPVILGSMYSSSRAAPYEPDEENTIKAIVTREQMKIEFNEETKVITIITPNENQMVLSDDEQSIKIADQNGNSIELSESGIAITSATSITMTAEEEVTITANTGITAEASGGEVSISGLSITASADTELSLSGEASAQLTSAAEVQVTGAMVMIN